MLFAVVDGSLGFTDGQDEREVADGGMTLLSSGRSYRMRIAGTNPLVAVMPVVLLATASHARDPLSAVALPLTGQHRDHQRLAQVLTLASRLQVRHPERGPSDKLIAGALMNELMLELLAVAGERGDIMSCEEALPDWLRQARHVIHQNYQDPDLTVARLAAACERSTSQLTTAFRRFFDASPKAYLHHYRLTIARRLVEQAPHDTIVHIMQRCGYRSRSLFVKLFREQFGEPPSYFRG